MKVLYDGKEFEFELEDIDVAQAKVIKVHCQLTMLGLQEGIGQGDPDALRAIYWLMHAQSGVPCDIDRANFKLLVFTKAISDAMKAEKAITDAAADPKEVGADGDPANSPT